MRVAATISISNCLDFDATGVGTSAMFAREKKARLRFFDRLSEAGNEVEECMAYPYCLSRKIHILHTANITIILAKNKKPYETARASLSKIAGQARNDTLTSYNANLRVYER